MEKSLWQHYNDVKISYKINEDKETEVLIIGAGITGISLAYNFLKSNKKVIIIDRNEKPFDEVTAKSSGKVTWLQDLRYQDIYNVMDYMHAKAYFDSQKEAIDIIKNNIEREKIDCDFVNSKAITFTTNDLDFTKFDLELKLLKRFNAKINTSSEITNDSIKKSICTDDSYVFNPVKYLKSLLKRIKKSNNIRLYCNSIATNIVIDKDCFKTTVNGFKIKSKYVVLACNYPFFIIPSIFPFKTYMEKSYIVATNVKKIKNINGITGMMPTISFRYNSDGKENYFIFLNNSSKICDKLNFGKNYESCTLKSKEITKKNPTYKWTNMDVMTNDFLPLIGRLTKVNKNLLISTGYNTWGMTGATIGAKILFDIISGNENKYVKYFDPNRGITIKKFKNFINNTVLSNTKAYVFNLIKRNPSWYKNKACVTNLNGKRVGIYFDSNGKRHVVSNICPHLKCFLTFNEVDKTWDCPCHGSRFDIEGNSIKGPSCYNIKIDETK